MDIEPKVKNLSQLLPQSVPTSSSPDSLADFEQTSLKSFTVLHREYDTAMGIASVVSVIFMKTFIFRMEGVCFNIMSCYVFMFSDAS